MCYYSGELSTLKRQKVKRKTLYLKGFFSHSSSPQLYSLGLDVIFLSSLSQARGLDLSRVRACVVVAEERPRMALTHSFSKLFKDLGLHPRSVSTAFGCRVNLAICLQVKSKPAAPADCSVHAVITKTCDLSSDGALHSTVLSSEIFCSLNSLNFYQWVRDVPAH